MSGLTVPPQGPPLRSAQDPEVQKARLAKLLKLRADGLQQNVPDDRGNIVLAGIEDPDAAADEALGSLTNFVRESPANKQAVKDFINGRTEKIPKGWEVDLSPRLSDETLKEQAIQQTFRRDHPVAAFAQDVLWTGGQLGAEALQVPTNLAVGIPNLFGAQIDPPSIKQQLIAAARAVADPKSKPWAERLMEARSAQTAIEGELPVAARIASGASQFAGTAIGMGLGGPGSSGGKVIGKGTLPKAAQGIAGKVVQAPARALMGAGGAVGEYIGGLAGSAGKALWARAGLGTGEAIAKMAPGLGRGAGAFGTYGYLTGGTGGFDDPERLKALGRDAIAGAVIHKTMEWARDGFRGMLRSKWKALGKTEQEALDAAAAWGKKYFRPPTPEEDMGKYVEQRLLAWVDAGMKGAPKMTARKLAAYAVSGTVQGAGFTLLDAQAREAAMDMVLDGNMEGLDTLLETWAANSVGAGVLNAFQIPLSQLPALERSQPSPRLERIGKPRISPLGAPETDPLYEPGTPGGAQEAAQRLWSQGLKAQMERRGAPPEGEPPPPEGLGGTPRPPQTGEPAPLEGQGRYEMLDAWEGSSPNRDWTAAQIPDLVRQGWRVTEGESRVPAPEGEPQPVSRRDPERVEPDTEVHYQKDDARREFWAKQARDIPDGEATVQVGSNVANLAMRFFPQRSQAHEDFRAATEGNGGTVRVTAEEARRFIDYHTRSAPRRRRAKSGDVAAEQSNIQALDSLALQLLEAFGKSGELPRGEKRKGPNGPKKPEPPLGEPYRGDAPREPEPREGPQGPREIELPGTPHSIVIDSRGETAKASPSLEDLLGIEGPLPIEQMNELIGRLGRISSLRAKSTYAGTEIGASGVFAIPGKGDGPPIARTIRMGEPVRAELGPGMKWEPDTEPSPARGQDVIEPVQEAAVAALTTVLNEHPSLTPAAKAELSEVVTVLKTVSERNDPAVAETLAVMPDILMGMTRGSPEHADRVIQATGEMLTTKSPEQAIADMQRVQAERVQNAVMAQSREPTLRDLWEEYDSEGRIGGREATIEDLAEAIRDLPTVPEKVLAKVEAYEDAVREDREEHGMRSGLPEDAGEALEKAVRSEVAQATGEMLTTKSPEQAIADMTQAMAGKKSPQITEHESTTNKRRGVRLTGPGPVGESRTLEVEETAQGSGLYNVTERRYTGEVTNSGGVGGAVRKTTEYGRGMLKKEALALARRTIAEGEQKKRIDAYSGKEVPVRESPGESGAVEVDLEGARETAREGLANLTAGTAEATSVAGKAWRAFQESQIGHVEALGMPKVAEIGWQGTTNTKKYAARLASEGRVMDIVRTPRPVLRSFEDVLEPDANGGYADLYLRAMDAGARRHWGEVPLTEAQREVVEMGRALHMESGRIAEELGIMQTDFQGKNPRAFKAGAEVLVREFAPRMQTQFYNKSGPLYEALMRWIEATYNQTRAEVEQHFSEGRGVSLLDATEVRRHYPYLPSHLDVPGEGRPARILETRPKEHAERLAFRSSHVMGARSVMPQPAARRAAAEFVDDAGLEPLPPTAQQLVDQVFTETKSQEKALAVAQMVRAMHGMPIFREKLVGSFALPRPGETGYEFMRVMNSLATIPKAGALTMSFAMNLAEPIGNIPYFGGANTMRSYRDVLAAFAEGRFAQLHREAVAEGYVADTKLNTPWHGDRPVETFEAVLRKSGEYLTAMLRGTQDFNEMVNYLSAKERLYEMQQGRGTQGDRKALKLLGFTEAQASAMLRGEGTPEMYERYKHNIVGQLAGGKSKSAAETSDIGNSRKAKALLWFTNFFQARSRAMDQLSRDIAQTQGEDRALAFAKLAQYAGMTIVAGAVGKLFKEFLLGNSHRMGDYVRETVQQGPVDIGKDLLGLLSSGVVGGLGQPVTDALAAMSGDEGRGIGESIARTIGPVNAGIEFSNFLRAAFMGGDVPGYENMSLLQKTGKYLRDVMPAAKAVHEGMFGISALAITEKDPDLDAAQDSYYRWRREHKPFPDSVRDPESRAWRDSMRQVMTQVMAGKEWGDEDLKEALLQAVIAKEAETNPAGERMSIKQARNAVAESLEIRKMLPSPKDRKWSKAEVEKLHAHLGEKNVEILKAWDATLDAMAKRIR